MVRDFFLRIFFLQKETYLRKISTEENVLLPYEKCERYGAASLTDYCMEELRHLEYECFMVLLLNTKCELINEKILSMGTVNYTCITSREVYRYALSKGAVYIIVVHNHPSGDPTPSREDSLCTKKLKEAGELVGIPLIDHIIIGDNRYISLKEQDMI